MKIFKRSGNDIYFNVILADCWGFININAAWIAAYAAMTPLRGPEKY